MEKVIMFRFLSSTIDPVLITVIIAAAVVVIGGLIALIVILNKRKSTVKVIDSEWIDALGGKENVQEVTAVGSRLSVKLVDQEKANRDKLKELGVSNILVMSNKMTLVIEGQAEKIGNAINQSLNKE